MFVAKTKRIKELAKLFPDVIKKLDTGIFENPTGVYIDWANVLYWQDRRLGWHFCIKRQKQFFDSFDTVQFVKIYTGTLEGNEKSEETIRELNAFGYEVITKPVKLMKISIDASSVPENSPVLLQQFIAKPLLKQFDTATIITLNRKLKELNQKGIFHIEDMKCNFDVEMGGDMLADLKANKIKNFIVQSADSDFANPVKQIINNGKEPIIFATPRKISSELATSGAYAFDVQKISQFICWAKEIPAELEKKKITSS